MSQINTNPELYNLAKALETLTNGHITVSEVFFLDELWFGRGDNYALSAYYALPDIFKPLMANQIQNAIKAADWTPPHDPVVAPSADPSMGVGVVGSTSTGGSGGLLG